MTTLCEGTVNTAKRMRHLAWDAADRASWSPEMSVTSLHQVAAASTVTSHNCEVLLKTLAARAEQPQFGPLSAQLFAGAEAARRARQTWLSNAHAVDHINTDTRGQDPRAPPKSATWPYGPNGLPTPTRSGHRRAGLRNVPARRRALRPGQSRCPQ